MLNWFFLKKKILLLKIWRVVIAILRSGGNISKYPQYVSDFEQSFARYIGCEFGMTFCNGTSALEAALFALGIESGDEVLVSSCTIHATAAAIVSMGAQPVYVDIDPHSLNFDPEEIDKKVTAKTRCLIVVHLWGNPADMDLIKEKAGHYNLKIIEDCSHAHGATLNRKKVGSFSDIACFSLQGYKAISAAEGGITVTDQEQYHHRLTLFGHFGRDADAILKTEYKELLPTGIGTKRRANPLGICMAAVDLQYIDQKNKLKRRFIQQLERIIAQIEGIEKVVTLPKAEKGGFFPAHPIIVKPGVDKELVLAKLRKCLRYRFSFGRPKFFKPPKPHYHQMRHLYDLKYRERLIKGSSDDQELSDRKVPSLIFTESTLERIIFVSMG